MGIRSALCNGVSGFNHHPQTMGLIGTHLADTATLDRTDPRTLCSFLVPNWVLSPCSPSRADRDAVLPMGNALFCEAIVEGQASAAGLTVQGDGFFVFREAGNDTAYYSRASAFGFDHNGYLVNGEGLRIQGQPFDPIDNDSFLSTDPVDIQVAKAGFLAAQAAPVSVHPPRWPAQLPLTGRVAIDSTGVVMASSQGRRINIARLVLAKFQNAWGLKRAGAKRYTASAEAGAIRIGLAGTELGQLVPKTGEQAALDMGQEFVKRISSRRGFRSNPKIIATVDDMLNELINRRH